jgi:6-hydroxycyclohex-1-ene-1-carbonyl-CoA dehydrogenase
MEPINAYGFTMESPNEPLVRREWTIDSVGSDDAVVAIAGCGLCHTDITFYTGAVKTNVSPVILGHEISGTVVAAGDNFKSFEGKQVIVPAVLPCGECDLCRAGRGNICRAQKMPGNDFDGGFASHVVTPARYLCELPENLGNCELHELSVIADAVTTPYQSLLKSGLDEGDLAIVIGVGGIGTYMVQHANNAGARVIAIDIDDDKLENAKRQGAEFALNARDMGEGDVKKAVRELVKEQGLPKVGWRVFETSGTAPGQATGFALLTFAGTLGIVGFTMDKLNVRLSNVMAFDADIFGNWGCKPEHYPACAKDALEGRINLRDNIEARPLETINDVIPLALAHKLEKRVIFTP